MYNESYRRVDIPRFFKNGEIASAGYYCLRAMRIAHYNKVMPLAEKTETLLIVITLMTIMIFRLQVVT